MSTGSRTAAQARENPLPGDRWRFNEWLTFTLVDRNDAIFIRGMLEADGEKLIAAFTAIPFGAKYLGGPE